MAGNTKLYGFASSSAIQIGRWGKKVVVEVGASAVSALREAAYSVLPKEPNDRSSYTHIYYNAERGEIGFDLHPREAETLLKLLNTVEDGDPAFTKEEASTMILWAGLLGAAIQERGQHMDKQNEPGVDGDGLVE